MGKTYIIYRYYNKISNKNYIGQTCKTLRRRHQNHISESRYTHNKSYDTHFKKALRKYGKEDWDVTIICENIPDFLVNPFESYWIHYFNSYETGYNSTLGGQGTSGISPLRGRTLSDETKAKISKNSKSYKGQPAPYIHTLEQRKNVQKQMRGNNIRAASVGWSLQWPGEATPTIYTGISKRIFAENNDWPFKAFKSLFSNGRIPTRGRFKGVIAKTWKL